MHGERNRKLLRIDAGLTSFRDAWDLQKRLVEMRINDDIPDALILTEHRPAITMGRAAHSSNLLLSREELKERDVEVFEIERGGDITFHGPGQLVAYPIIDLSGRGRDLHRYLRDLEQVVIATLAALEIEAGLKAGLTGVWANDHKLAAIGVAVKRWIAYHGLALNVNTDLDCFKYINPCGITEYPVGSVESVLGRRIELNSVANILADNFAGLLGYEIKKTSLDEILMETVNDR